MSHQSEHFPTFSRAYRVVTTPARSMRASGLLRLERVLLRMALYLLLFASGLQHLLGRFLAFTMNWSNFGRPQPVYFTSGGYPPATMSNYPIVRAMYYALTVFALPEQSLLVAVLCMVGLAALSQSPALVVPEADPTPRPERPPIAPPTPPQRHPLDPSPDDPPPIDYPWLPPRPRPTGE